MAVSPQGTTVFVTGEEAVARAENGSYDATVAYRAATGARLWTLRSTTASGTGFDVSRLGRGQSQRHEGVRHRDQQPQQ